MWCGNNINNVLCDVCVLMANVMAAAIILMKSY